MHFPLISIIITAYNYAPLLPTALRGALAQDYPNLEILVLDNASTDDTTQVVAPYLIDPRVRYLRHASNIGATANHNAGVQFSQGEYLIFLSADDMMLPGRVMAQYLDLIAHPEVDLTFTAFYVMTAAGVVVRRLMPNAEPHYAYHAARDDFAQFLAFGNFICFPTLMIPRRLFDAHGLFHSEITATDFEMVLRWTSRGVKLGYLPQALHANRIHDGQASSDRNYIATGRDLEDLLALLAMYVQPGAYYRIRGFEHNISRCLGYKYERSVALGFVDDGRAAAAVSATQSALEEIYHANLAQAYVPKLSIFIENDAPVFALAETIQSLVAQTDPDWEAFVLQSADVSLAPLCDMLDPLGRVRVLCANRPLSPEVARNHALFMARGNTFAFLRAGSAWPSAHVAQLKASFAQSGRMLGLCPAQLNLVAKDGTVLVLASAFDIPLDNTELALTPSLPLESISFRREVADELGCFREDLPTFAHWELLLRFARAHAIELIPSVIGVHYFEGDPLSLATTAEIDASVRAIYQEHHPSDAREIVWRQSYLRGLSMVDPTTALDFTNGDALVSRILHYTGMMTLNSRRSTRQAGSSSFSNVSPMQSSEQETTRISL